ncbi:MAG: thiamine pyrophosphate-dependent enzyme [Candidatus Aenigmatarchaeota archaeon]
MVVNKKLFYSGHTACAGCGMTVVIKHILEVAGPNTIISNATSCSEIVSSQYPKTAWGVPYIHVAFETAASVASGIEAALKKLGGHDTNVVCIAGDGGTYDIGLQALSGMVERGHNVLYICYSNGAYANCLSLSSLIMTENGLKKITEINHGDYVYAFDMKKYAPVLKKCTGVFDNGKKEIFEIMTLNHNIKATANHPFLVVQRNGRGIKDELIWKTLSQLKAGDEIVVLKKLEDGKSYKFPKIKISKKGDYKVNKINDVIIPEKSNKNLMKLLGIYVGDGWTRINKAEVGFAVPENNRARELVLHLVGDIFGLMATKNKNEVHILSINVAKFVDSLGFGKGAKNKTIPPWIFTLGKEERQAFVDGLMLSDGYKISNSLRYVSSSHDLLTRLRLLLQTLDYRVGKIHWRKIEKGKRCGKRFLLKDTESGYVCFSIPKGQHGIDKYPSQSKNWNFLAGNKFFETVEIKSITSRGIEPTLDLQVEGAHNFIANGMVVHNTGIQRSSGTPFGAWTTTSPVGKKFHGNKTYPKPIVDIMVAHGIPYAATASVAYPQDLQAKIKKALKVYGPKFILVDSPCPPTWKCSESKGIEVAKSAVGCGIFPLYEVIDGKLSISMKPKMTPVEDYLRMQGRFAHLTDDEITQIQKHVDNDWKKLSRSLK